MTQFLYRFDIGKDSEMQEPLDFNRRSRLKHVDKTFKAEWTGHVLTAGATGKIVAVAFGTFFQTTPLYFAADTANTGTTVNLTADGSLNVTAHWDNASADDDIIVTHGWIEFYNQ